MPENKVNPFNITDAQLTIDLDGAAPSEAFSEHVSSVICTPTSATSTWKGMKPAAVFQFVGSSVWGLALAFAQDWSETGLSRFLFDHEGEDAVFTFAPETGGAGFAVVATIVPGAYGGAVDATGEATSTMPVKGRPVLVDAVPVVPAN